MKQPSDEANSQRESTDWHDRHARALQHLAAGDWSVAMTILEDLARLPLEPASRALIFNDLGVLHSLMQHPQMAEKAFQEALDLQPDWDVPRRNGSLIAGIPQSSALPDRGFTGASPKRIGIVSLLFNWPSTGGGTVHTAETARFLSRAGYDVRHWVIRYSGWSVGQVTEAVDWPIEYLDFADTEWRRDRIQHRVREAAQRFQPDHVILTDSWSFKPRLAEALRGYSYFLRLAAQECLCPLSNIRLLGDGRGGWRSCPQHQLATPDVCRACVAERFASSGRLHQAERALAAFEDADYGACLRRAFAETAGVLAVNPLIAEAVKPYAPAVHVLPSGFDAARFPAPGEPQSVEDGYLRILFAGLVEEPMKGFAILHAACAQLWEQRQDFRLVVTGYPMEDPPPAPFVVDAGWQSQAVLPDLLRACDIVVCPTVAEEALGRTAVEAMGAGRPVVASRIGGLSFTVLDEATGLLCPPGDVAALARQLRRLLDHPELRQRCGAAGRQRFLERYTWEATLPQYVALFGPPVPPLA